MATTFEKERQLQDEIGSRVEHDLPGVEVLAVELANPERFVVYVDHPDGVDHVLCERVTDVLRSYLQEFTVEVSSPGPERPLRKREHYEAAVGKRVAIRTGEDVRGRRRFRGEVLAADDQAVTLAVNSAEPLDIRYETIVRGNLIDEGYGA